MILTYRECYDDRTNVELCWDEVRLHTRRCGSDAYRVTSIVVSMLVLLRFVFDAKHSHGVFEMAE